MDEDQALEWLAGAPGPQRNAAREYFEEKGMQVIIPNNMRGFVLNFGGGSISFPPGLVVSPSGVGYLGPTCGGGTPALSKN